MYKENIQREDTYNFLSQQVLVKVWKLSFAITDLNGKKWESVKKFSNTLRSVYLSQRFNL